MKRLLTLLVTHAIALVFGFAAGVFALPILIAPPAPDNTVLLENAEVSQYVGTFSRDRTDSDFLHWGEGEISISHDAVTFMGELAPGPDYRLYFSPEFVDTEADFNALKSRMVEIGPVRTFNNFALALPEGIDPQDYGAVIVWCETFGEFITSASLAPVQR